MEQKPDQSPVDLRTEGLPVEWSVSYGHEHPEKRYPVLAIAGMAGALGYVLMHNWIAAVIGVVAILMSTAELFLPWKYRVDDQGAEVKIGVSRSFQAWSDVKRATYADGLLVLSPLQKATRLDAFRGVKLRISGNQSDLLVKIAELLKTHGCILDRGSDTREEGRTGGEPEPADQKEGS